MTAYEKSMVELVERIEVLEQWKLSFDSRLSDHAAIWLELSPAVTALETRVGVLEAQLQLFADAQKYVHQARWHATYNAALTKLAERSDEGLNHNVHMRCAQYANRAHGPLTKC